MVYPWDHELLKCGKQNEKSRPSIAAQWMGGFCGVPGMAQT